MAESKRGFVVVLTDESGSMHKIKDDSEGGYKQFLDKLRESGADILVTRFAFSSSRFEQIHKPAPVSEAPAMEMFPGGNTPLLDSIGKVVVRIGKMKLAKNRRITLVIITDGQENCSTEYQRADIAKILTMKQKQDNWEIVYLGANQDAFAEAGSIGVPVRSTANWKGSGAGAQSAYLNTGVAVAAAYSGAAPVNYTETQRTAMVNPDETTIK